MFSWETIIENLRMFSWEVVGDILPTLVSVVALWVAAATSRKQNRLSEKMYELNDFAEVFMMPQVQLSKKLNELDEVVGWNILFKNASSYPIYLDSYTINDDKKQVGGNVIPASSENWYVVPIPDGEEELSISVTFSDHRGNKFRTLGKGEFVKGGWSIHSYRREVII